MLASCIMPTADRRRFVPGAIESFLGQDYSEKELLIVDDGADPVGDLVPDDSRIRYFRHESRQAVGTKRNFACGEARGEVIAHWDDDDWSAPWRLSYQVAELRAAGADICGLESILFYAPEGDAAWEYRYPGGRRPWVYGATLCYTKAFWAQNPFPAVNVGEDSRFVWARTTAKILSLPRRDFFVGVIHASNVSPKRTKGAAWKAIPSANIASVVGEDMAVWKPGHRTPVAVRNVFACLVHERPECVRDLVRNLRCLDPDSVVILYNGGRDGALLSQAALPVDERVLVHPNPRSLAWGALHWFALDCMAFALERLSFDTLTIVDSDQLALRPGYSQFLAAHLATEENVGLLGNSPSPQPRHTRIPPAVTAWQEVELWRPFLRKFPDGEAKFVHWSFWPSTVITSAAARELVSLFTKDLQLQEILRRSRLWATEEILFPTLTALLGFRVIANPCRDHFVQYRKNYSEADFQRALAQPDAFWMHPVPRQYGHVFRGKLRDRFAQYAPGRNRSSREVSHMIAKHTPAISPLLATLPVLECKNRIEGWLEDDEADLLLAAARHALENLPATALVEIGSYCGRSTVVLASAVRALRPVAKVFAIDPFDGDVGAADVGVQRTGSTWQRFCRNMEAAGVADYVKGIAQRSYEVVWDQPIGLLFIDGLHDYENVARDFRHFEQWLASGSLAVFHDFADYYPGVQSFVGELIATGGFELLGAARSLVVLRKSAR